MLSTGLHFASESTVRRLSAGRRDRRAVSAGLIPMGKGWTGSPSGGKRVCQHLQLKDGLRNLHQCLVRLARWRATE
jgi:hypothetical protein